MIHIEAKEKVYVVRGGVNFKKFGDPYEFTMIVETHGDTAYITALSGKLGGSFLTEIKKELRALGFKKARWDRYKGDTIKEVLVED